MLLFSVSHEPCLPSAVSQSTLSSRYESLLSSALHSGAPSAAGGAGSSSARVSSIYSALLPFSQEVTQLCELTEAIMSASFYFEEAQNCADIVSHWTWAASKENIEKILQEEETKNKTEHQQQAQKTPPSSSSSSPSPRASPPRRPNRPTRVIPASPPAPSSAV